MKRVKKRFYRHKRNKHHLIPLSRGGSNEDSNIIRISIMRHQAWHYLFENATPFEVCKVVQILKTDKSFFDEHLPDIVEVFKRYDYDNDEYDIAYYIYELKRKYKNNELKKNNIFSLAVARLAWQEVFGRVNFSEAIGILKNRWIPKDKKSGHKQNRYDKQFKIRNCV